MLGATTAWKETKIDWHGAASLYQDFGGRGSSLPSPTQDEQPPLHGVYPSTSTEESSDMFQVSDDLDAAFTGQCAGYLCTNLRSSQARLLVKA